jgi:hypothetical protein
MIRQFLFYWNKKANVINRVDINQRENLYYLGVESLKMIFLAIFLLLVLDIHADFTVS